MGRKSLADERRAEILAAFEQCIVRYGLDVPLEQIADQAGVKRSLIRHYIGNRGELVDQMIERISTDHVDRLGQLFDRASEGGINRLLDFFFEPFDDVSDWDALLMAVINSHGEQYHRARLRVGQMLLVVNERLANVLLRLYPQATPADCSRVAYGLLSLVQMNDALECLGINDSRTTLARANAERLLADLQATADTVNNTSA
ncbi:MAG: hypothetical protein Fur005_31100 [Roseiflexaceae bacterium]